MEQDSSKPKGLKYISILEAARQSIQYINDRRQGLVKSLRTPWKKFNDVCMGGIEWHTITTIAGASGSGKTAIANELEDSLFTLNPEENFSVLSLNFEMLAHKLVARKISKRMQMPLTEIFSTKASTVIDDNVYAEMVKHAKDISTQAVHYVETAGTVEQIKSTIWSYCLAQRELDPDKGTIVILDHTLLVNGKTGDTERTTLFDIMVLFNTLKKQLKISFIILSQLNRDIETSERIQTPSLQAPRKSDLFGGESVYQFSDIVLVSHRPEMLGITNYTTYKWLTKDIIFFHFLKVRDGEPCVAAMKNNLKHNQVLDYNPEE
jgi:replicative DNA helicase